MNKMLILIGGLAAVVLTGCTTYTGIAFDGNKAYISAAQTALVKKVYVCDVGSDGMLNDCKSAKK